MTPCRPLLKRLPDRGGYPGYDGLTARWAWRCWQHHTGWYTAGDGQDVQPVYEMAVEHVREWFLEAVDDVARTVEGGRAAIRELLAAMPDVAS
jgi:hypothetical protein